MTKFLRYLLLIITSIMNCQLCLAQSVTASQSSIDSARANAQLISQIEDLKEQIKTIRGDVEQLQFDNVRLNDKLVKLSADVEFRFNQFDKKKNEVNEDQKILDNIDGNLDNAVILQKVDGSETSKPTSPLDTNLDPNIAKDPILVKKIRERTMEQEYQDAYSVLKERDYKKARQAFLKFVDNYPESELSGSAHYWIGETYFAQDDFDKAALEYLKGYQANIRGSRAPDNLLKLAKSLAKTDKRKNEACITLLKLKTEFPNAQNTIKKQMQDDLKNLKCNINPTTKK